MNGILLATYIENITTRKDKTVKLTLGTQELSPGKAGELFQLMNKLTVTYLSEKEISQREMDQADKLDPEFGGKTQSQRLRNVFYKLYEQAPEGFKDFSTYYHSKMDLVIEHYKTKIQ
jgi:hypothetical protein